MPLEVIAPATVTTSGTTLEATTVGDPPIAAIQTTSLPSRSATLSAADNAVQAEKARAKAVLIEFKRFKPLTFLSDKGDLWVVKQWINHIEKLFRGLYMKERDMVHLAAHYLEGGASK